VTPNRTSKRRTSHGGLLDPSRQVTGNARFDAIVVPTNRPVEFLQVCIELARETSIPLIIVCSKKVTKGEVVNASAGEKVEGFAVELPWPPTNPLKEISFATSTDKELLAASFGRTRDLSNKRNLGLVIARMVGWQRLMFLDDDISDVSKDDMDALAAALDNHNVSVLIPDYYQDNSVAYHACRLGGGEPGTFASAGAMGVRCDQDDLGFFPNIYNEDWFFFAKDAATHKIAEVGASRQREYNPYNDPRRAIKEEFGDLLAEGLYARLDADLDIPGADAAYWNEFIKTRADFLGRVMESLAQHRDSKLGSGDGPKVRAARVSIRAAQDQLERIDADLCQKFIHLWQADLIKWRRYLAELRHFDSVESALTRLGLDYEEFPPDIR
jgi:glycosyltransferase involved in cell wall biosynthesis